MQKRTQPSLRQLGILGLCCYMAALGYILFYRTGYRPTNAFSYWDYVKRNIQLIPFHTVKEMTALMINSEASVNARILAAINIIGNILLMFPAGLFLPIVFKRFHKFSVYALWMLVFITCIEILQVLTACGSFDMDDILLNYVGAMLGFLVFGTVGKLVMRRTYGE